jgi:hypothetical protein
MPRVFFYVTEGFTLGIRKKTRLRIGGVAGNILTRLRSIELS